MVGPVVDAGFAPARSYLVELTVGQSVLKLSDGWIFAR